MKEQIMGLGRLARFSALGISLGMWPKEAVAHALKAENLRNYAAALGYTPGDVAAFLVRGLTIEQAKGAMCEGLRPEGDVAASLELGPGMNRVKGAMCEGLPPEGDLVCIRPEDGLCFHPEVDHGISMDPANPRAMIFWTKCRTCDAVESSPDRSPVLIIPRKIER